MWAPILRAIECHHTIASPAHAMGYDLEVRFVKRGASARRVAEPPESYKAKAEKQGKKGG